MSMPRQARAARLALLAACLTRGAAGARPESVRVASTASGQLVMQADDARRDNEALLFVDAGSSGSKLFAYCKGTTDEQKANLFTQCKDTTQTNLGIASLAYASGTCSPWKMSKKVGATTTTLDALGAITGYPKVLLNLLSELQKKHTGTCGSSDASNYNAVPILATAGMRLLSQTANENVWAALCGQTPTGQTTAGPTALTTAPAGSKCGTIPGTMEAYYEFLANAEKGAFDSTPKPTATFTVGGASAQIALPLKDQADVNAFLALIEKVRGALDCTTLTLANGDAAPIFSPAVDGATDQDRCLGDYIAYKPWSEITISIATAKRSGLMNSDGTVQIKGLGLVSFLGLNGRGTMVAGGVNEIQNWAAKSDVQCVDNSKTFETCSGLLRSALDNDVLWKSVKATFAAKKWADITKYSYNTAAAIPAKAITGRIDIDNVDQAWTLQGILTAECAPPPLPGNGEGWRFGHENANSCMKAYYTSLYITAFFAQEDNGMLRYDPGRDWAEGASKAVLLQTNESESASAVAKLLETPVRHFSASYMEGAMAHFAAGGA